MIVTAKDAHDFCIVAATIIPVLVLTRFVEDRGPIEVSGRFMKQGAKEIEADIEKIEYALISLEKSLPEKQRAKSIGGFLQRVTRSRNGKRRESEELDALQDGIKVLREQVENTKERGGKVRADLLGTVNLGISVSLILTALALCAGVVGEFVSILGVLEVIDRGLAISIHIICINLLLFLLVQFVLARFIIGPETISYRGIKVVAYSVVSLLPLILLILLTVIVFDKMRYTP